MIVFPDEKNCEGCKRIDPVEEWNEAIKGKPIAEWPPMPKEIDLIVYDNGIILTTAETIEEYMKIKMGVSNA
jgi:hypothetical protein